MSERVTDARRHLPVVPPAEDARSACTRRQFLRSAAGGAAVASLAGCGAMDVESFLHTHFRELSREELKALLARTEQQIKERFKRDVHVSATPAREGVVFGYGLDLSRCVGCRRCVYACVKENNQSRDPQIQWIRVLEMDKEHGVDLRHANPYYDASEVPHPGKFYMPVQCHHCADAPCVKVCPVQATWQEPDGIVVIDYDRCVGCRCCMAACPYGARRFNWGRPSLPAADLNPDIHYLGNRPRPAGVVEKCTFCIQRVREGRYPACVEICPTGSRKFGNLLDPDSEIRYVMEHKRVFIFKEELNTQPRFFYFYGT